VCVCVRSQRGPDCLCIQRLPLLSLPVQESEQTGTDLASRSVIPSARASLCYRLLGSVRNVVATITADDPKAFVESACRVVRPTCRKWARGKSKGSQVE
jgi:hypothetical protein